MASIVMADSLDSYASFNELASSKRWLYTPLANSYATQSLVSGGGRYGGNAIRVVSSSTTTTSTSYNSNNMMPITIPGYMSGCYGPYNPSPLYQKALQFGFWFKSSTSTTLTNGTVPILMQCLDGGGQTNTVLYNQANLAVGQMLSYTTASSPTTQGTLTFFQLGTGGSYLAATCPINLNDGNWHWIELCVVLYSGSYSGAPSAAISASSPSYWLKCYVDQTLVLNQTSGGNTVGAYEIDYINYSNVPVYHYAAFFLCHNAFAGVQTNGTDGNYYDDIITCVSAGAPSFPFGPRRMACLRPTADGDVIGYVPFGSTDNYSAINKGYSNTSSYVQSTGFNVEDRYKFPALSYVPSNVNAVIANIQAGNFEPGTTIGMSPVMFDGTTEVVGARVALSQMAYSPMQYIYETDNSGNSWTASEINSIQVGFKSIQ